jgi:outer membrane protein TolC
MTTRESRTAILACTLVLAGCVSPALAARHRELERRFAARAPSTEAADEAAFLAAAGEAPFAPRADEAPLAPAADEAPFAGAAHLEREALVREVLRRNPSIEAARQAWRAALERYPQEVSLDDPSVRYGLGPRSFGSSEVRDAYRVDLSQPLPFPGKLGLRGEVALAEAEAAEGDFESVRLRLAETASLLFDDYYAAERSLEINAAHLALLDELLRIATARYEVGEGSQQDPLAAEVERARLLHDERRLQARRYVAAARINALLHRREAAPLPLPPRRLAPPPEPAVDREGLAEQALRERPELRAAQARVRGGESAVTLARREFLPDFALSGGWDGFWQDRPLRPSVGIEVEVPLQVGRRRAALAEARARLAGATSERTALEDRVRLEVESAAERLAEAHHLLHIVEERLLPAERDRVAAARAGFETGRNDFDALITAQRGLRDAELDYQQALADVSRRHAQLRRAIGALPGPP